MTHPYLLINNVMTKCYDMNYHTNCLKNTLNINTNIESILKPLTDKVYLGILQNIQVFEEELVVLISSEQRQFILSNNSCSFKKVLKFFLKEVNEVLGINDLQKLKGLDIMFNTKIVTDNYGNKSCILSELYLNRDKYVNEEGTPT